MAIAGLVTIKKAAEELGIAEVTMRKYIRQNVVKPVRIGGLIRFTRDEIERIKREGITFNEL